jgi:mono/diheme cytochrome c family protein
MDETKRHVPNAPRRSGWWPVLVLVLLIVAAALAYAWRPALAPASAALQPFEQTLVERGAHLAAVGTCAACHTVDPARPYAGGLALQTPFGTIYSTNITPDARTGIGSWSEQAFTRALREGVSIDGHLLYPAFPYDHYTRLTQDDIHALYAYFMTREPIDAAARENELRFPFGFRPLVAGWNLLYLHRPEKVEDPKQSAEWNRGAYLADALGHCSACHSPRNRLGAEDLQRRLDGGEAEGWYVPALNAHSPSPQPWSRDQLAEYLRTGIAPDHAVAGGPMQGVVHDLAHADPQDVQAIATYIHSLMAPPSARLAQAARARANETTQASMPIPAANDPEAAVMRTGAQVYRDACARCHDRGRETTSGAALQLPVAVALYDPDSRSLVHIIRDGIDPPDGEPGRMMPAFAGILTDDQIIALTAYLRRYGAHATPWPQLADTVRKARTP